jgi:hypothetical protein
MAFQVPAIISIPVSQKKKAKNVLARKDLFYYNRIKSGEMEEMEREKAPPS